MIEVQTSLMKFEDVWSLILKNEVVTIYCDLIFEEQPKKTFKTTTPIIAPEIKQDHRLNLSISVSRGKETNKDCLSSGE